jgi:glycosyltransferase involved in cell wall biosynthesis
MAVAQVQGEIARGSLAPCGLEIVSHFTDIGKAGGGVPRSTLEIARMMAAGGHRHTVLTAAGCTLPEEWLEADQILPRVVTLDPVRGRLHLLSRAGLRRVGALLREADLLLLHGMWRPRNTQLASLARRLGLPYVMIPHGMLDDWPMRRKAVRKRVYHRLFESRNLAGAAHVIATSDAELEQAGRWIPHQRVSVAPLPFSPVLARLAGDPARELVVPEAAAGELTVLFLSRLHPKKGVEVLIEAVGLLTRRGIACRLLISGSGPAPYVRKLERLVQRHGIADRTRFLGWVDGLRKLSLYKVADLLALPTSQENFGRVLIESLLCRTPVVTTCEAGIWRQIRDARGGLLAERTPEAFAAAIAQLQADRPRREQMGEAGRRWALDWLDERRLIGRYESMFHRAAGDVSP